MSLLTIVQDVADLVGIPRPTTTQANDIATRQFVALLNVGGKELADRHAWRNLIIQGQVTGDGTSTSFALPADFAAMADGAAIWQSATIYRPLVGPLGSSEWVPLTNAVTSSVTKSYRLRGSNLEIYPAPGNGEEIALEYQSSHWVRTEDGATRRNRFLLDTDVSYLPEELHTLDLIWRWRRQKGLTYSDEFRTFEQRVAIMADQDRSRRPVAAGRVGDELPVMYVPDTIPVT